MIGIYKITDLTNNYVYIGQSIHIETRWSQHKQEAKNNRQNTLLYNAMRKHGIDNFLFEIIEECNEEDLNEKEIKWINYYNSYFRNDNSCGYNMTPGGQEKYYDIGVFQKLWDEGYTVGEIVSKLNCSNTTVQGALRGYNDYNPTESHKRGGKSIIKKKNNSNNSKILQYTIDGDYIASWNSCKEIERELKISSASIGKVLNRQRNSAGGFRWCREGEQLDLSTHTKIYKKVGQYDLNNNLIAVYKTVQEAAKALNKNDSTNINAALKGKNSTNNRFTAYGYIWKYID